MSIERKLPTVPEIKAIVAAMQYDMSDMNQQLQAATLIATLAHAGQSRKNGQPYIFHSLRVSGANTRSVTKQIIGILHDVLEDSGWTADNLRELGFSARVIAGVEAMTKRPGELYFDFGERCSKNADARDKKIEDLSDNLNEADNCRFIDIDDVKRINKYKMLREYLVAVKQHRIEAGSSMVVFARNHPDYKDRLVTAFLLEEYSSRKMTVVANDTEPPPTSIVAPDRGPY